MANIPNHFEITKIMSPSLSPQRLAKELVLLGILASSPSLLAGTTEYMPIIIQTSTEFGGLMDAYNQPNNSSGYYESQFEYGMEATLDPTAPTVVRNIELPYFSNYAQLGALTVRIYANDGPLLGSSATPGTLLDEVVNDVAGPGLTALTISYAFNAINVLPSTVTVTLDFDGIGGANTAGWYLSTAPNTVGTRPAGDYFWQRTANGDWSRQTTVVPEPGMTAALAGLSLLGFGMVRASLRRSKN